MAAPEKRTIIFSISHLYLFWATGVYYVLELSKDYKLVLVADESLKSNKDFLTICKLPGVEEVFYLPLVRNFLWRHFYYSKILKILVYKYKPFMVLQHNHIFAHNVYLFYWSKKADPECVTGVYLNGLLRKTDENIISFEMRDKYIEKRFGSFKIAADTLKTFFRILRWSNKLINNYLLPRFFTGNDFKLRAYFKRNMLFSIPKEYDYPTSQLVDFYLTYYSMDKEICRRQYNSAAIFQISHPAELATARDKVAFLHPKDYQSDEENIVLILPGMMGYDGMFMDDEVLSGWITAIAIMREKFNKYRFLLKLHPATLSTPEVNLKIKEYFHAQLPDLVVLDPGELAGKWISKSRVIVGDVSTTLWWANFFHSKIVISFDTHSFAGSDDMNGYEGIYYFSSMDEFQAFEFPEGIDEQRKAQIDNRIKLPTVLGVVGNYSSFHQASQGN